MENALKKLDEDVNPIDTLDTPAGVSPLVLMLTSGRLKKEDVQDAIELQKMHEEYEAKKAFSVALAKFRKMAPTLAKDRVVDFSSQKGRTHYAHTSLGHGMAVINPILGECDLNLSWHPRVERGVVYVTTTLSHTLGHSISVELPAEYDTSGNKNKIQAMKSAISYLERIGAFSLLGLASHDDDDGASTGSAASEVPAIEYCDKADHGDIESACETAGMEYGRWVKHMISLDYAADGDTVRLPRSQKAKAINQILRAKK